jgi:D-alanine-D-alanine ligase-like ATP-grasp enzyme
LHALNQLRRYYALLRSTINRKNQRMARRFTALRDEFYRGYWEQAARETSSEIDDLGFGFLRIRRNNAWTAVKQYNVMLDNHLTLNMAGNKLLSQTMLAEAGYPVPRLMRFDFDEMAKAVSFMEQVAGPVVVKPASGTGAGRGITTKISSQKALRKAATRALAYSSQLLIEEQVRGASFRLLFLDGELIDAIRRDPPALTGDGRLKVIKLIAKENQSRLGDRPIRALSPLTIDMECRLKLAEQELSLSSVPASNQRFLVKDVVNQNCKSDNHVVRAQVDPSFHDLGRAISHMFKIDLLGLDIIATDIDRPLSESGGVINEINTTPGLHHHHLVADDATRLSVGALLLNRLLSTPKVEQTAYSAPR